MAERHRKGDLAGLEDEIARTRRQLAATMSALRPRLSRGVGRYVPLLGRRWGGDGAAYAGAKPSVPTPAGARGRGTAARIMGCALALAVVVPRLLRRPSP
jgi:hypothetical protein